MLSFMEDLAGAIGDLFKSIPYFFAGFLIVAVPLYSISKILDGLL